METWRRNLQYAAAGATAAAAMEILEGGRRTRLQALGRCLLGGGAAVAYAHLVPASSWGVRSGAAFAQLPMVRPLRRGFAVSRPVELAVWGGLTGLLLRWAAVQ